MKSYLQKSLLFDKHLLKTPIQECGEEIVDVKKLCESESVSLLFACKEPWLRKSVADALLSAAKAFNSKGYMLRLEDAYRSLTRQQKKFLEKVEELKKPYPKKPLSELQKMANTYVAGIPILAAHTAAAAVDVTLFTLSGEKVNMGCDYHTLDEHAVTAYPRFSKKIKENRIFLKEVMQQHGFINYPFEYWHFSIGDVGAAYLAKQSKAIYAPIAHDIKGKKKQVEGINLYKFFS